MPNPYIDGIQNGSTTIDIYDKELRESLGTASTYDVPESGDASDNEVVKGDDTRLGNIKGNNTVLTTDKTPFLTRQTLNPTGFSGYVREKLIGASYAWNQLESNGDFSNDTTSWSARYSTVSVSGGIATVTPSSAGTERGLVQSAGAIKIIQGHKYILRGQIKPPISGNASTGFGSTSTWIPVTANVWNTVANIIEAPSTADTGMYFLFKESVTTSQVIQFQNCQITDLTLAFGSTIADYLYGLSNNGGITKLRDMGCPIDSYTAYGYNLVSSKTSGKKIVGKNKNDNSNNVTGGYYESNGTWQASNDYATSGLIPVLPNTTYVGSMFDKNGNNRDSVVYTLWSDSTTCQGGYTTSTITTLSDTKFVRIRNYQRSASYITAKNFVFQLEIGSTNTAFEEYSCTTYPLGNDELRGKFDLVNGEIVASGDVKESNGGITRYWKEIDLGSLDYQRSNNAGNWDNYLFYVQISDMANYAEKRCAIYTMSDEGIVHVSNKCITRASNNYLYIRDDSYTDTSTFKTAMNGVKMIYPFATPTTEQSTPFADPMSMAGATTEEYIDTRDIPCPVGAERQYMGESDDIIPIPSSPMSDGKRVLTSYKSGDEEQLVWEGLGNMYVFKTYTTNSDSAVAGGGLNLYSLVNENGYKPIGIISVSINNSYVSINGFYINNNYAVVYARNYTSSTISDVSADITVLLKRITP